MNANSPHLSSDSIDQTIDNALAGLRNARPRSGLSGRILTSLEHRAITPHPLRAHFSLHLALWTASAAAVLAVASMIVLHNRATAPTANGTLASAHPTTNPVILSGAHSAKSKDPDTTSRASNPEPFSTTNLAQTSIEPTHRMAHRAVTTSLTMPAACAQPKCPIHDGDAQTVMNGVSQTPTDAQLLADLHAPSHPAPPLPLTPQEKLFVRTLRYGNLT